MRGLSICLILLTGLGAVSARSTRARAEADDGRITRPLVSRLIGKVPVLDFTDYPLIGSWPSRYTIGTSEGPVPLGTLWVLGSVTISALCGTGVALCREIMLEEVQRRLPEGQKIKYPYLSYKYSQIVQAHEQFYPESRIRAVSRFLFGMALVTMGSLMITSFGLVMFRQLTQIK